MNSNTGRLWPASLVAFFVVAMGVGIAPFAQAAVLPPTPSNPKPAAGDLILPMPGGEEMVFRRVRVPGKGFWGDQSRIIQIGDASGGIFEGLQRTQVSGSFPSDQGDAWEIILGKYELTRGQFAAVMGMETLVAVSHDPEVQTLSTLKGRSLREALMKPLTYVSYGDVVEFLRRYNQWLFDPAHPERVEAMPRVDGVPGYVRLPTEDEWEYCARGGMEAIQAGTFDERLPFPVAEAVEFAWILDNAKHKLRPIGLRKPDIHGFYDLLGNAQEMTAGLFRPEVWQGKPGGVPVRGGSVSTPLAELRSSLRAELDVYGWDPDAKKIEERKSFNTGARLALGSNVVVSSAQRRAIEREYAAYKAELRRTMPVGRTLDNLVSQASVQIGAVDPIIERLIKEHPELQSSLAAVQDSLSKARERLELAQRESARSLAQDASRNGVNLSVYLSRLERLAGALATAKELAATSARYQEQVAAVEKSMADLERAAREQFQGYRDKVGKLGEYSREHREFAFQQLESSKVTSREREVLTLLKKHVAIFADQRRADPDAWFEDFRKQFRGFLDS
ncbi:MAG: hypothetical protein JG760_205 [Desulfomicrobiaceae bacterium]|nr:hypothetical protein [Desulfomicrobiaceae bacterium]